jgi:hypothetical protein
MCDATEEDTENKRSRKCQQSWTGNTCNYWLEGCSVIHALLQNRRRKSDSTSSERGSYCSVNRSVQQSTSFSQIIRINSRPGMLCFILPWPRSPVSSQCKPYILLSFLSSRFNHKMKKTLHFLTEFSSFYFTYPPSTPYICSVQLYLSVILWVYSN